MEFLDLLPYYALELLNWLKPFLIVGFVYLCIRSLIKIQKDD